MSRKLYNLMFFVLLLALAGNVSGAVAWTDGAADHLWSSTGNWSTGVLPTSTDHVQLKEVGSKVCEIDASMTGATKALAGNLYGPGCFAAAGTTTLNISGELSVDQTFSIGYDPGATGVTNLSGNGSVTIAGEFRVGYKGDGTLNMTGGTVNALSNAYVGRNGVGTLNISSGTFTASNYFTCGYYGTGTINVSGGGTVNINGPRFNIGFAMPGTVTMDGGTVNTQDMVMASSAAGVGSLTVNSGTFNATGLFFVGEKGSGSLTVNGGTVNNNNSGSEALAIAKLAGSTGNIALNAGTIIAPGLEIGAGGLMDIEAGTLILDGYDSAVIQGYVTGGFLSGYGFYDLTHVLINYDGDLDKTYVTAIPEPATLMLLGLGGLALIRRKRSH